LLGACLGTRLYRCEQIVVKGRKTANFGWYPRVGADVGFVSVIAMVEKSTEWHSNGTVWFYCLFPVSCSALCEK